MADVVTRPVCPDRLATNLNRHKAVDVARRVSVSARQAVAGDNELADDAERDEPQSRIHYIGARVAEGAADGYTIRVLLVLDTRKVVLKVVFSLFKGLVPNLDAETLHVDKEANHVLDLPSVSIGVGSADGGVLLAGEAEVRSPEGCEEDDKLGHAVQLAEAL
ncbi:hypothetical protein P3342_007370 [Pyrenophora teres f. teres]|nr:hypothetical protein P3342_007370 [Pyrenophora teres f. teres]